MSLKNTLFQLFGIFTTFLRVRRFAPRNASASLRVLLTSLFVILNGRGGLPTEECKFWENVICGCCHNRVFKSGLVV